ncbi:MAG: D-alanyl-D-alanine carboxypeptidase/D-alanyl-D-alanine-endopeptidase [Herminiimonas sp.]|nr:D-alanyl-D-alanine carboxypeptidase/D-alanyl-D-alanine-endopeptidase [Herminiimonas sp.]
MRTLRPFVCRTTAPLAGLLVSFLVACALACPPAAAQAMPPTVVAALKRAAIPQSAVGTYVQEIDNSRILIAANTLGAFNPASTMKLVTSVAALDLLGTTYTWKTRAFANGLQTGDVLDGDLVFKGGGDPKLVLENFWLLLRQVRARGVRDIRGNVVLDRSVFDEAIHDPAGFDGDPGKPYNAGPDGLLLSYKALGLHFLPDAATGVATVTSDPALAGVTLVPPQLSNEECGNWQAKLRLIVTATQIAFDGRMPAACGEKDWFIHPYGMTQTQYFGAVFRQMWRDLGGTFTGNVVDGVAPPQARQIAERESVSLPEVLRDMNKFSNNVMARQLLLTLATEVGKQPGNTERGAHVVKTWLATRGIENPELIIENGAGLSRIERIAPSTLGRMLVMAYRASTMPEFVSSLPLVGFDGTMRRRLQDRGVAGNAHIKTGTLAEVRAIAGYVQAASGKQYAVVSLINHANASRGQEAQDLLLQWIYENG